MVEAAAAARHGPETHRAATSVAAAGGLTLNANGRHAKTCLRRRSAKIKDNVDELPAGSSIVGILIAVLLVLVILDIIGVTNIFTFINPAR